MSTVTLPADEVFSAAIRATVWLDSLPWHGRWRRALRRRRIDQLIRLGELAIVQHVEVTLTERAWRDIGYWLVHKDADAR